MSGRISRLRFRYRPSKPGRAVAYTIVLVGFAVWMISGGWQSPEAVPNSGAIPFWTLVLAGAAYFLVAFLEKFGFEEDDTDD